MRELDTDLVKEGTMKKILVIAICLFIAAVSAYAGGSIKDITIDKENRVLRVTATAGQGGAYISCTFYTDEGKRIDEKPIYFAGNDMILIVLPSDAKNFEVGVWEKWYKYGRGPEPNSIAGKLKGFYYWNNFDRAVGEIKDPPFMDILLGKE